MGAGSDHVAELLTIQAHHSIAPQFSSAFLAVIWK